MAGEGADTASVIHKKEKGNGGGGYHDHPRFVRSTQLQEACSRIPAPTLHDYLAKRLWPLRVMHHPHHPPVERCLPDLKCSIAELL